MLKIVLAPNSVLASPAKRVSKIDKDILNLIEEIKKALLAARDPEGVGLAAPQIGKSLQIFIIKPTLKSPILTFINPTVQIDTDQKQINTDKNQRKSALKSAKIKSPTKLEGCLSLQDIWGTVIRKPQVSISYLDEKGKEHKRLFKGFQATIIQHEMDHLQGILFPKRVLEQKGTLYKSHKTEKGEIEFEEIEI